MNSLSLMLGSAAVALFAADDSGSRSGLALGLVVAALLVQILVTLMSPIPVDL